jgi:MFS family permease
MNKLKSLPLAIKQYLIITGNYWAFTLTDGALRMLVVLYFHQLGFAPLAIAMLFLFYEFFGVVTNLVGGWLGAKIGLNKTMHIGLFLQVFALLMLTVPEEYLSIIWVMAAQALSGVAKDLNKMSAKSSIKTLLPPEEKVGLFKWVALLTGSKNALKGVGFFLGAVLLSTVGFKVAVFSMAVALLLVAILSTRLLKSELGKAKNKIKFTEVFSKSASLNYLSAARLCLFAARDVWFVVALPVYLAQQLHWQHHWVGAFIALWIVGYGLVQSFTPKILQRRNSNIITPDAKALSFWAIVLSIFVAVLALALSPSLIIYIERYLAPILIIGLLGFGVIFAINSSLHSYMIISLAKEDGVSLDVGFYYMANALGRLFGTVLSGWIYQSYGLIACLMISAVLAMLAALFVRKVDHCVI